MGTRSYVNLDCAYCETQREDIAYAPTCGMYTFDCKSCDETNFIKSSLEVIKLSDVKLDDIKEAFLDATSVEWSTEDINRMCKETLEDLLNPKEIKN